MRFLPIVDRELREGSRRRGTYWLRVRVAFQALLIGLAAYFINLLQPQVKLGAVLFWGLAGVSMIFCLLAGRRSTADCLSQEKREGTLGLLFLTDLKGYDVVLGKLVATSISGFYALVAIFPVLAIPLLAGGMTNGEFWRMVLVLVNTFFLSLAIGMFASAVSREHRAAMAMNFFLAVLVMGVPAACEAWCEMKLHRPVPWLFYSCPVFSFIRCGDVSHPGLAEDFWGSLAVSHGLAWMLTLLACWIVPRTWGDKPAPAPSRRWRWRDLNQRLSYGSQAKCAAFRQRALDVNAYYWLAARVRLKPVQVWLFLGSAAAWWFYGRLRTGANWMEQEIFITVGLILNSTLKLWIAVEAGQRLGEDRRSGAFELLLATPLTVGDFLRGQMLALRRQFLKPLLVVTCLEVVLVLRLSFSTTADLFTCTAGICMLWADVVALTWVAMAAALTCKNQTQATSHTVVRILILPWVAYAIIGSGLELLYLADLIRWQPGPQFGLGLWFGLGLAADLLFGLRAWHTLRKNFRRLAVQSFLPEPARSPWWRFCWRAVQWTGRLAGRCVPARARTPVFACLAAGVALAAILLARRGQPQFPPPALVSITQSNAPFNVFPGGDSGVFFIMPDGTLWQWGKPGAPQSPRAVVPRQIGTAHDWVKVVGAGTHCLGLRSDGTIWGWGFSNGKIWPEPQPAMQGHEWIDLGTGQHDAAAVKRDGTLWAWNEPLVANDGHPTLIKLLAPESDWAAVYCGNESTFALRKDGTLWAGGTLWGFEGGIWVNRIISFPTLVCAETNWTALDANGLARNQAGELWDIKSALPNPQASASAVCSLLSTNWAAGRIHSVSLWTCAEVHADGTLWTAQIRPSSPPVALAAEWRQLGARSDWAAVWGHAGTGFGLTADGTVWTWGIELGKEPVKTYESRLELLRDRLTGRAQANLGRMDSLSTSQPRPLLKLVGQKADQKAKEGR
jgi:ABC-type transport system involved in cytochrome c biogenesis permease component